MITLEARHLNELLDEMMEKYRQNSGEGIRLTEIREYNKSTRMTARAVGNLEMIKLFQGKISEALSEDRND